MFYVQRGWCGGGVEEESELRECGAGGCLGDAEADAIGHDCGGAEEALVADAGGFDELRPLVIFFVIDGKGIDALTQLDVFAEAYDIKRHGFFEAEDDLRCGCGVVGGPIGITVGVYQVVGGELLIVASGVARLD